MSNNHHHHHLLPCDDNNRASSATPPVKMAKLTSRGSNNNGGHVKLADMSHDELSHFIASQIVGRSLVIETPFGHSKLKLYCDYTASGQELRFIVDKMTQIGNYYANTHNEMATTGVYMNALLSEAQELILTAMKASPEDYFLVCGGTGSTYAMEMAQKFLGTYLPPATRDQMLKLFPSGTTWEDVKTKLREKKQLPLVIASHMEHHSNEVTWRHQLCDLAICPPSRNGDDRPDLVELEKLLKCDANKNRLIIGSFSAGSNVTGIKTDQFAIATLMKRYKALVFFDCAAVGPYVAFDLSRKTDDGRCLIDGIYLSPHKFLGGPGSCGLLVFNRKCYDAALEPTHGGGGTVQFVDKHGEIFKVDPTARERSGTPGILQIIKTGLAFQLKSILQPVIEAKETSHLNQFYASVANMPNFQLLGPGGDMKKVCIISFMVRHQDRYLHPNLVARLLNDIFGIQAASGNSCAGPYGLRLLNIDDKTAEAYRFLLEPHDNLGDQLRLNGFKYGWARVTLHYTMTGYELDYLLFAIDFICKYGPRFLPVYQFNPTTGIWQHANPVKFQTNLPVLSVDESLFSSMEQCDVDLDESTRRDRFMAQQNEALALLNKLPPSKELDAMPELPVAFFYVEKSMLLERDKIVAKASALKKANINKY